MNSTFPAPVPEIPVADIDSAIRYYQNNFGFTLDWGDQALGLAGISRGDCRIFLANTKYRSGYGNIGPVMTWLNLDSKQAVDDLHRAWTASAAKLISAPESKPWGPPRIHRSRSGRQPLPRLPRLRNARATRFLIAASFAMNLASYKAASKASPKLDSRSNLGVNKPHTDDDKPSFM